MKHIAELDYKEFFKEYFNSDAEFDEYYNTVKTDDNAKKMFHQTARIISLADELGDYIAYRPAINLLFYLMTAELVAKLFYNYKNEGESKKFVNNFFKDFCGDENKVKLSNSIQNNNIRLNLDEVIEFFYKIRCDVVHEGNYYKYSFRKNDSDENNSWNAELPDYEINISIEDIRKIIIESSLNAVRKKANKV